MDHRKVDATEEEQAFLSSSSNPNDAAWSQERRSRSVVKYLRPEENVQVPPRPELRARRHALQRTRDAECLAQLATPELRSKRLRPDPELCLLQHTRHTVYRRDRPDQRRPGVHDGRLPPAALPVSIMCAADTNLEGETEAGPGWGSDHTCADYDAVLDWANGHGAMRWRTGLLPGVAIL
ncbi:hypothetical protein O1611_g392 [Lasiodiplodia mahajangana]|uniref:Uncharacterized protein n=1 Tax=Lasiodiplodia mahajangana TaxID=1108764 RepID=A0ACC2K0Z2_9PEZI|nr:hypothetical protein O1611_g392 [Lasiodiplodia mahajangana]